MPNESKTRAFDIREPNNAGLVLIVALVAIYLVFVIRRAWIGDDAFITLRTVDNFVNGHGLVWNPGYRVQSFTNPLWLFLISSFYFLSREPYFTTLTISILASLAAVILLMARTKQFGYTKLWMILILVFSNAFVDYSTSGLENPLSYLLLITYSYLYFSDSNKPNRIFFLSLLASFAALNRLDSFIIYIPPLIGEIWRKQLSLKVLSQLVLGCLPIIAWELFSLVYYGLPFPSTFYSKLGGGIASSDLWARGYQYFLNSFERDPITLSAVFIILALASFRYRNSKRTALLAAGIGMYLVYVASIAGDFMSGRFFALPRFGSVILVEELGKLSKPSINPVLVTLSIIVVGLSSPLPTFEVDDPEAAIVDYERRILDARLTYFDLTGLVNQQRYSESPPHQIRWEGEKYNYIAEHTEGNIVLLEGAIGFLGYYAGPEVIIIDHYGLTDPLRAQLPADYQINWRTGHFIRYEVIPGYEETLASGVNTIKDSGLHTFYDYMTPIITGPLWSFGRFVNIYHLNLGHYDHLIDFFYYTFPEIIETHYSAINDDTILSDGCIEPSYAQFKDHGLLISIPLELRHSNTINVALQASAEYELRFLHGSEQVDSLSVSFLSTDKFFHTQSITIPESILAVGFDQVHILPKSLVETPRYCLAYLTLENDH